MDVAWKVFFSDAAINMEITRLNLKTIFVCERHIIAVKVTVPTKAVLCFQYKKNQRIKETCAINVHLKSLGVQ